MTNYKRILTVAAVLMCLALPAQAQIFIEEGKFTVSVDPGQNVTRFLKVHNTSDQPIRLSAYWQDFVYQPPYDGKKKFFPPGVTPYAMDQWITFAPESFTLPPFGQKEISCVINVPSDTRGGHYGVLFIEKDPAELKATKGLQIVARVGCLFFVETKNKDKSSQITGLNIEDDKIKGDLVNQGDVILIPGGVYYVMDGKGYAVDRGSLKPLYIPPGETAPFVLSISPELDPGRYTVVLTFDLKEGDVLVREIDFEKSPSAQMTILDIRE